MRRASGLVVAAVLLLSSFACAQEEGQVTETAQKDGPTITVGSANFTEAIILGEIYAQGLEARGYDTAKQLNIGARDVYFPALEKGDIDLLPEYTGSLLSYLSEQEETPSPDSEETYQAATEALEGRDITLLEMAEAQDKDGIVVNKETAERYDLTTLSDLAEHSSELVMGGPPECPERQACLKGLREVYDMEVKEFKPLDTGGPQTIQALKANEIQIANLFTTDSRIAANDFVLLEDDKGPIAGAENVVVAIRDETLEAYDDELVETINAITAELTTEGLLELNSKVDNDKLDADDVARAWLEENDLLSGE